MPKRRILSDPLKRVLLRQLSELSYKCVPILASPPSRVRPRSSRSDHQPQTSTTVDVGNRVGEGEQGSTVLVTHLTPPPLQKSAPHWRILLPQWRVLLGACFKSYCATEIKLAFLSRT
ncbi:hypothetical protein quinque_012125 [Culex quinquefasciatus]